MKDRKLFSGAFLNRLTSSAKASNHIEDELRVELRQFRAHQSGRPVSHHVTRTPSPMHFSPGSTMRELPYPLNTMLRTPYLSSPIRPISSKKRTFSIIDSVRELEISSPKESSEAEFKKARSIYRLNRGLKVRQGTPPELMTNPLHTFSSINDFDHSLKMSQSQVDKERQELQDFIGTLTCFKGVKFELELNHEISRGPPSFAPNTLGIGSFYQITSKVSEISNYAAVGQEVFEEEMKSLTEHLREVLRSLRSSSMDNEAVILELFWRCVVKLVDTALMTHNQSVVDINLEAEELRQQMLQQHFRATADQKQDADEETTKLLSKISELEGKLLKLKTEKRGLEAKVIEREFELSRVTRLDGREDSVRDMNSLMRKLNSFIKEAESESYKQAVTLKSISDVMTLAEQLDEKVPVVETATQTSWSFRDQQLFPTLTMPLISMNPLHFFEGVGGERTLSEAELIRMLESVITHSAGVRPTWRELLEVASEFSPAEIWSMMHSLSSSSAKLMLKLLGKDGLMPRQLPVYLSKLLKQFDTASKGDNSISLGSISELITTMLPKKVAESLASFLTIEDEELHPIDMLLMRFVLAVEKTRKPFQNFSSQFASLSRERLAEIFFDKVKVTATAQEVDRLFDSIAIKNSISMHSFQEAVKFDARLLKARTVKVNKFDFLLAATSVWQEEFTAVLTCLKAAAAASDRPAFNSLAQTVELGEPTSLFALLKTPIETDCLVLADLLEVCPVKLSERRKKEKKKKKKT
jgi:hypothetical protein